MSTDSGVESYVNRTLWRFALPWLATAIAGTFGLWLQPRSEPIETRTPQYHVQEASRIDDHLMPAHLATPYAYKDCLESAASVVPAELRVRQHACPATRE